MNGLINITYPESLANSMKLSIGEFEKEIKLSAMVKLYELGRVSSGVAAKVLGLSRLDFLDIVAQYKVSIIGYSDIEELNNECLKLFPIQPRLYPY
jgi:predicted HTH domain antitoxin